MTTEVNISTDDILKALGKTVTEKWKLISVVLFFAATMFFAGGYYVYSDAKNDAREMKLRAYEALLEVQTKKEEITAKLRELDKGVSEAQTALDKIVKNLNESAAEYERATQSLVQEQEIRKESNTRNEVINKNIFPDPIKERFKAPNLPQIQQKAE